MPKHPTTKKSKTARKKPNTRKGTPHDALFPGYFGDENVAREYVQRFYPENLRREMDISSFKKCDTSYVNARFAKSFSDVVYEARLLSGKNVRCVFLFEHKSEQPKYIFLQLLDYMLQIWEEDVKNKRNLSLIVPTVVYHGNKVWNKKPFEDYFGDLPLAFKAFVPIFDYLLTDLVETPVQAIRDLQENVLRNLFLVLKFASEQDAIRQYWSEILRFNPELSQPERVYLFFNLIYEYLIRITSFSEEEIQELNETLTDQDKKMMSTYDTIVKNATQRGIEQGLQQGLSQGLQQGLSQGLQQGLSQGLQQGLSEGLSQGLSEGLSQGLSKGAFLQKLLLTINLIAAFPQLSDAEVAKLVEMPAEYVQEVRQKLNEDPEYPQKVREQIEPK